MGTYTNTFSRTGSPGSQLNVLFQKTDWKLADLSTSNIYWIGAGGLISTLETTYAPFEVGQYSQIQLIINFSAVTGTSPNLQFGLYMYDDPTGQVNFGQLAPSFQSTNWAVGASAALTTGMPAGTSTSDVTKPAFVRIQFFTSGTWTALGTNNRVTLLGIK